MAVFAGATPTAGASAAYACHQRKLIHRRRATPLTTDLWGVFSIAVFPDVRQSGSERVLANAVADRQTRRKREPGGIPGLPRSGEWERPPS